ncbi:hypothetical protein SAMN05428944_3636 [Streptomyces sp. 1222.5]|nr:hypothetical protein BX260_4457 [Streptomyces sp. 5112.2]SEC41576.1 hypothetical protein SAMN05428944_3636 [Streptomyces sp. 1222.5]
MNQEISTRVPNFTVRLSPTPLGARLARLLATERLRTWGLPPDPAALVVAELAANAVVHGRVTGRDFRLTLYAVAGTLRIEVTDTRGDRLPPPGAPRAGRRGRPGSAARGGARRPLGHRAGAAAAQDGVGGGELRTGAPGTRAPGRRPSVTGRG